MSKTLNIFASELNRDSNAFKTNFLVNEDLGTWIEIEKRWIHNNLNYINTGHGKDIILEINPNYQLFTYNLEEENSSREVTFIFLPKYLALQKLHIHYAELNKADLFFKTLLEVGHSFHLHELRRAIIQKSIPEKEELLSFKLQNIIHKFLSYQYLVID